MPTGIYVRTEAIRKAHTKHEFCNVVDCNEKHFANGLCKKHCRKQYYQDHKKELVEYTNQYYEEHKEEKKQYYIDNKEKLDEQSKQYAQDNKEERSEYNKQYYKTPAGKASRKACNHNRRAMTKGLTSEEVQRVYEDNIKRFGTLTCILCGKSVEFKDSSLEHLTPLSRGGTNDYDNLGVAHLICNIRKHTMTLEEWFEVIKELA